MSRELPHLPTQHHPAGLPTPTSTHSFWHSQPSPLLTGHRSTRNIPKTADVVIIGSGMTGASVAHHLLSPNAANEGSKALDVVMLEAREACYGATGRNGGHCQPLLFENPHDPSIGEFELLNFHTLQAMIEKEKIDCEFVAQPGVRAIYSQHHFDEAEMALSIMATSAPDLAGHMRLVTKKEELKRYRIPTAVGAVVTDTAARMWPYKFVAHILTSLLTAPALRNGSTFNLQTLTPVSALEVAENNQWTVKTERGSILASKVILATNAYTSHLLPSFADLIVPCRGQMSALHPRPSLQGKNRLQTSLGFLGDGLDDYLIQRPNATRGHLMFGGGRQHGPSIGVTDDSTIDEETATYLRRRLVTALSLPEGEMAEEGNAEFKASYEWTGIMAFSRDNLPFVGPVPEHPNLYLSAGYTGHGMPNTWLCGAAVALMVSKALAADGFEVSDALMEEWVDDAANEMRLPMAYRLTAERMKRAAEVQDVASSDWAEMERGAAPVVGDSGSGGGRRRGGSGAWSGYA